MQAYLGCLLHGSSTAPRLPYTPKPKSPSSSSSSPTRFGPSSPRLQRPSQLLPLPSSTAEASAAQAASAVALIAGWGKQAVGTAVAAAPGRRHGQGNDYEDDDDDDDDEEYDDDDEDDDDDDDEEYDDEEEDDDADDEERSVGELVRALLQHPSQATLVQAVAALASTGYFGPPVGQGGSEGAPTATNAASLKRGRLVVELCKSEIIFSFFSTFHFDSTDPVRPI